MNNSYIKISFSLLVIIYWLFEGFGESDVEEVLVAKLVSVGDDVHIVGGAAAALYSTSDVRNQCGLIPRIRNYKKNTWLINFLFDTET